MKDKEFFKRHIEWLGHLLLAPARYLLHLFLARKNWVFLYRAYGSGLGDALAISVVLDALNQERPTRAIVFSKFPALFHAHPQVMLNLDYERMPRLARSLLKSFAKYFRGRRVIHVGREKWLLGTRPWQVAPQDYGKPWIMQMIPDLPDGLPHLREATPGIHFDAGEIERYARKFAHLPTGYAVVKASVGANRPSGMAVKNWEHAGFQAVVDAVDLPWVQVGEAGEQRLANTLDLLGQTSVREVLFVLSRARLTLTVEGLVSHGGAAFGKPVVVVFSGFHDAHNLCYPNTRPVVAPHLPPCAPCYLPIDGHCMTPGKPCTAAIDAAQVIAAVQATLSAPAPADNRA